MNTVQGLQTALRLSTSDKIKDRTQGIDLVREIFSNRENLNAFGDTARKEGGAAWIAFYQCLFQVVVMEKKAVVKPGATTTADKRLADAISLIRWMTERTVHMISKKPFIALFNHMTSLLVFSSSIFPPAALDYTKALKTLLSYSPHLESLDQPSWKILMGVCWASILGDEIAIEDAWDDEQNLVENGENRMDIDGPSTQAASTSRKAGRSTISQVNTELLTLIPILLSSSAAPIIPTLPAKSTAQGPPEKVGYSILLKIHRFFNLYPTETSAHLSVLHSLNILLAELELNSRDEVVSAGLKLLPQLVALWGTRNKALREQVIISLRTLFPFVTHRSLVERKYAMAVRDTLEILMNGLSKETLNKRGIEPLDLIVLRMRSREGKEGPFELKGLGAGFEFTHENAMTWAVLELYRDTCLYLYESQSPSHPATPSRDGASSKRRRIENTFTSLISSTLSGTSKSRLLSLQVLIFFSDKYLDKIHDEAHIDIRHTMLEVLDDDDEVLQSWAFVGLTVLAKSYQEHDKKIDTESSVLLDSPSSRDARKKSEEGDWKKVWFHAVRKYSNANTCRAACHAACSLFQLDKIDSSQAIKDFRSILQNIDIQGPVFPYDSVCAFLTLILGIARSDVRMYSLELEDKALNWLEKCTLMDGPRGNARMEQFTPSDVARLLASISRYRCYPLCDITTIEVLPDAAVVDRVLEEANTKRIRDFLLHGILTTPSMTNVDGSPSSTTDTHTAAIVSDSLMFLEGRARRISLLLSSSLQSQTADWELSKGTSAPPERVRRCIDLIVLAISFQATIQLNGSVPDSDCIHSAIKLISAVQPSLLSSGHSIPAQHLIWRGFEPLVYSPTNEDVAWSILIQPDVQSGIRQDLLPAAKYDLTLTQGSGREDQGATGHYQSGSYSTPSLNLPSQIPASGSILPINPITPSSLSSQTRPAPQQLVNQIWLLSAVSAAFKDIFGLCLQLVNNLNTLAVAHGTLTPGPGHVDDDDFGEIRNAESDAMPVSKEALECQRTSASLLSTAIGLRLKGYMFSSNLQRPYKDPQLVNALLVAEGSRFIEIGKSICMAVQNHWLRLGPDAVELVLDTLEEMLRSYAYSRDTGLLSLLLEVARCSMSVWLGSGETKSALGERAMHDVCFIASRIDKCTITSWKVKIEMLRFLDEFLPYESANDLWQEGIADHVETDEEAEDSNALAYLSGSLFDMDCRVRMRAVTSASTVFYRPILPLEKHKGFYFSTLFQRHTDHQHFDSMITDILWKLNCCIATPQQRSAAVFHLYEIPAITTKYNSHLQLGLEAVSRQLGLTSISELYLPYAITIIRSQLLEGQLTMRVPHRLYGFSTRKAHSVACINAVGPFMLANQFNDFFSSACDAAGIPLEDAVDRAFSSTAALIFAQTFFPKAVQPIRSSLDSLGNLPGYASKKGLNKKLNQEIDGIAAHLWELLDLDLSTDMIADTLNDLTQNNGTGSLFIDLMSNDISTEGVRAIDPLASVHNIVAAYQSIKEQYPSLSTTRMVFNTILCLTGRINDVFLVSEQRRYLRSLALMIALHQEDFRHPTILHTYLREMLALLPQPDICGLVISFVGWGFRRLESVKTPVTNLTNLFIQLGASRVALDDSNESGREVGLQLEEWISKCAKAWATSDISRVPFEAALALWPESLRQKVTNSYSPLITDLINLSEGGTIISAGELCKQYLEIVKSGTRVEALAIFVESLFWHLKGKLLNNYDIEGSKAFLEILYLASGHIHAPPLDSMAIFSPHGTNHSGVSSSKQLQDPEGTLRASIIQEIVKLTDDDNHATRSIAYRVMQGMLPLIKDMLNSAILPPHLVAQLSVLTPAQISSSNGKEVALDGTINTTNWIKYSRSASHWSKELVKVLCEVVSSDDPFYRSLEPLLTSSNISTRFLLPYLIQAALTCGSSEHAEVTVQRSKVLSEHFTMALQWPSASLETTHSILDTVLRLRHYQPSYSNSELGYNDWLEIDSVILSESAIKCGSYATALLFLELARDQEKGRQVDLGDTRIQKIMYEIYSNVEDPDGFYGIENHDVRDALLRRLEHEGQSQRAFSWNGALNEASPIGRSNQTFLSGLHNLHSFGFNRLASSMSFQSHHGSGVEEDPFFFELAWRTGDWELPMTEQASKTPQGNLYSALRAVHRERDSHAALSVVNSSIKVEIDRLSELGMERMAQIKKTTTNLLCLREAAHWLDNGLQTSIDMASNNIEAAKAVQRFSEMNKSFEFSDAERLTATRVSLLHSGLQREDKNTIGDLLSPRAELLLSLEKACYLCLGEMARDDGNLQASINAVTAVQQLEFGRAPSDAAQDAFSHVLWAQNEHGLAIQHARGLLQDAQNRKSANQGRLAILQGRIGHWTALAKLKSAFEIKVIFDQSCGLAQKYKIPAEDQARIFYEYACFADNHYNNLAKSSELERLKSYHDRRTQNLQNMSSTLKSSSRRESTNSKSSKAAQEAEEDVKTIKELESGRLTYIKTALKMYAQALALSNAYDDSITQLVSLWLQHDDNEEVNSSFSSYLNRIPSHKFVFLGPQLAARLYRPTTPTSFNSNLNGLMLKMSKEHPFHILYQVITLAHGISPPTSARRKSTDAENQGRGPAALEILYHLNALPNDNVSHKAAKQMKVFVVASVNWSRFEENLHSSEDGSIPKKPKAGSTHMLPANSPLSNLRLDIPIATCPPPIDLSCRYDNIPTLLRYRSNYMIAGGVHRPRIMRCIDSTNKQHQQLFKADDEVRQDAVMEQVFTMTNDLLIRDRQAKARSLKFRTYNVVPLPERTGIIEFVEGTKGIGEWLKPAHLKYRSGIDILPSEFQSKISQVQERDYKSPDLVKRYNDCMKRFQPVMRHFFVEKHKDPMAWFTMRLNYSRSVAVTSIVGWMVGLGDRHCSNILIDQSSGELVHIDFGIVFEEGRKLRIPEMVPFRLTNDLVDGFGITGVEGTFRRCSEHTLRVLRDSSSLILTVLEVFKHDPLYAWAGDPDKLQRAQGGGRVDMISNDANVQEKADRVLGRIKGKLGTELSVEYTVNMLIQEARNVEFLAKIYHGWASWF
ncbi:uncharacterized protein IL334_006094 [Kwoniella shivajii]|uniref:Serine/threonine-protein kinase Tel1 n=1 Tax=Kwoniella shivajii TaxID=564305 RepID=A0ABZ1D6U6_9TREE|nr:hypothetical protein IL334_006094 [Kwoniella shivajii]